MKRATPQRQPRHAVAPVNQGARLAVSVADGARLLGISRAFLYQIIRRGEIKTLCVGSRRLVRIATLDAFLQKRERAANQ